MCGASVPEVLCAEIVAHSLPPFYGIYSLDVHIVRLFTLILSVWILRLIGIECLYIMGCFFQSFAYQAIRALAVFAPNNCINSTWDAWYSVKLRVRLLYGTQWSRR